MIVLGLISDSNVSFGIKNEIYSSYILLLFTSTYYISKSASHQLRVTSTPPLRSAAAVKMFGTVSEEKAVKVPATEAWKLYSTLDLAKIVQEALPGLISKIEVVEGDGSTGTILELFFPPGLEGGMKSYKEKFTVVDDEKRVKETEVVEGGYLDLGFTLYRVRFEVIEVEGKASECLTRSTIEYELKDEAADNAAHVSIQPLVQIMQVAADHLQQKYNN